MELTPLLAERRVLETRLLPPAKRAYTARVRAPAGCSATAWGLRLAFHSKPRDGRGGRASHLARLA